MFHMRNIVGKRVKEARHESNPRITQAGLSVKLQFEGWNISRAGIAKIESGIRQVTDKEVVKLARILNVSVQWLLSEDIE